MFTTTEAPIHGESSENKHGLHVGGRSRAFSQIHGPTSQLKKHQSPDDDPDAIADEDRWTDLQVVARDGLVETVEQLLATDNPNVNAPAIAYRKLLAAVADVNAPGGNNGYQTAVQVAAETGHLDILEMLIVAKADINAPAGLYSGLTALQAASEVGNLEIVERLLALGADVNAPMSRYTGRTALHAASQAYVAVVKTLLAANADVNAPACRYKGAAALQIAARSRQTEIVDMLLTTRADVNAAGSYFKGGDLKLVEKLVAAGAYLEATSGSRNRTALQSAEIVHFLKKLCWRSRSWRSRYFIFDSEKVSVRQKIDAAGS